MTNQKLPPMLRDPKFLLGAAAPGQFPQDNTLEIAFAGRSNAGKSSAINAITARNKLARTSKTPGRTQQINFFTLGDAARLVDLPGYGYAKAGLDVKKQWQKTIETYLTKRENLLVLVLLMDIRHPLTELDRQIIDWVSEVQLPTQVLLTKADKFSKSKIKATSQAVAKELALHSGDFAVEPFSIHSPNLVQAMQKQIEDWVDSFEKN